MSRRRASAGPAREDVDKRKPISEYTGRDRYIDWIRDYLNIELTAPQKEIVYAIQDNQKTLVVAGNGFGKTYGLACFTLAFLFTNYPASVLATSGTYGKLRRTYCKPIQQLHKDAYGLPGRYLKAPPRIQIESEPEVYMEATSPRDPGELEGVHNEYTLGIVEEADKDDVSAEIFDSMESLLTDDKDKLVAIANPPRSETNIVNDLMADSSWTLKQFSSFDSHNVEVELTGEGEIREGLVTLDQIKQDWEAWNVKEWPGIEEARNSDKREDLDTRWYRRRMGVIAPAASDVLRPFTVADVENAYTREPAEITVTPQGLGMDVVRGGGGGGDYNALAGVFGRDLRIMDWWRGEDHIENEEKVRDLIELSWSCPFAVDSVGTGDGLSDRISTFYPERVRFNAGSAAADPRTYDRKWTEGLCLLGEFLRDGAGFRSERLREELLTAARVVSLDETYVTKYDTERYSATRKAQVKDRLGRSPDLLDAAYMAVLMARTGGTDRRTISSTW